MEEWQGFKSLKYYNRKSREIIFPGVNLARVDHQQQMKKTEETKDEKYKYQIDKAEDIYVEDID